MAIKAVVKKNGVPVFKAKRETINDLVQEALNNPFVLNAGDALVSDGSSNVIVFITHAAVGAAISDYNSVALFTPPAGSPFNPAIPLRVDGGIRVATAGPVTGYFIKVNE